MHQFVKRERKNQQDVGFFSLFLHNLLMMHGHRNLKHASVSLHITLKILSLTVYISIGRGTSALIP